MMDLASPDVSSVHAVMLRGRQRDAWVGSQWLLIYISGVMLVWLRSESVSGKRGVTFGYCLLSSHCPPKKGAFTDKHPYLLSWEEPFMGLNLQETECFLSAEHPNSVSLSCFLSAAGFNRMGGILPRSVLMAFCFPSKKLNDLILKHSISTCTCSPFLQ